MKFNYLIILFAAAWAAGGCATSPNAAQLAEKVSEYRQEQSARVETLNTFFNDNYRQLIQSLDDISNRQLLADRDDEAQGIADTLISSNSASLREAFRQTFLAADKKDSDAIDTADQALEQARESYKAAYQALSIPLTKLKQAEQDLRTLSSSGTDQQRLSTALQWMYKAYQNITTQAQKDKNPLSAQNSKPTTGS